MIHIKKDDLLPGKYGNVIVKETFKNAKRPEPPKSATSKGDGYQKVNKEN